MYPAANGCFQRLAYAHAAGAIRAQTPARKRAVCLVVIRPAQRHDSDCRDRAQTGSDAAMRAAAMPAWRGIAFGSIAAHSKPVSPVPAGFPATARRAPSIPRSVFGSLLSWVALGSPHRSW